MSRSIFGWDLPPGCTNTDIERAFREDYQPPCCDYCEVVSCDNVETYEKYKEAIKENEIAEAKMSEEWERDVKGGE